MARTKRSISQEKKHRPYDQAAEPRSTAHGRVYDQAQEQPAGRRTSYGQYGDSAAPRSGRGFYDQQAAQPRPAAGGPDLLTDARRKTAARTGSNAVEFTVPVHRSAPQPVTEQRKPEKDRKKRRGKAPRNAHKKSTRAVRPQPMAEDDAPLPTTLRERGQAARRRARRRRTLLLGVVILLMVGIWVLIAFVFKISEVRITGSSVYNESVILENFGYREGDNLFTFSKSKAEEQLLSALPYLETVKIHRQLPGTVRIEVTASEEKYCFAQADGSTVITTPSFKVLRLGSNSGGLLTIRGVTGNVPVPGQPLSPKTEEDAVAMQTLEDVLAALEAGHIQNCTELDVSDPYAITLRCEDRIILQLGTTVELDYKLRLASRTIYDQLEADATGIIDVSGAGTSHSAYYRPQAVD